MNKDIIKNVIIDQKSEYINQDYVERKYSLENNINYVFVGIRRTGKSYLMYQHTHNLISSGINQNRIIYVNFEDERLLGFNVNDFNTLLEVSLEISNNEKPYFFFDEIQNVEGWEKFVRRLADSKYVINITGSNSKMLSSDIATTLGGRFLVINVYPYSFNEYLIANKFTKSNNLTTKELSKINNLFNAYLTYGQFPELVNINNKRSYLNNLYQTIYLGDIIARNKINNDFVLRLIIKKIAESVMRPISYTRLFNIIKSSGVDIGKQTVINYVDYIKDALLVFDIKNYASKLIDKETKPKYYFMDTGILGLFDTDNKISAQMENMVAIELIRRYGKENVYYFERNTEVDFYVPDASLAIQVSYSIYSNPDTYEREVNSLVQFNTYFRNTKLLILTMSETDTFNLINTKIEVKPLWAWLMNG